MVILLQVVIYTRELQIQIEDNWKKTGSHRACQASFGIFIGTGCYLCGFQALPAGSHVIIPDDIYYGTRSALKLLGTNTSITYSEINMSDIEGVNSSILPETRLIWVESPSNPKLKITDINAILKLAQKHENVIVACDNTWATSYFTQPLDLGCDLVMHSTTKYFGGHSDILGGALMWKEEKRSVFRKN